MLALILAVLSVSAAVGMRTALPLLVISLSYTQKQELWSEVPILNHIDPRVILAVSISWSIFSCDRGNSSCPSRFYSHLVNRSYWCSGGASSYPSKSRLVFPPPRNSDLVNHHRRRSLRLFELFCF